MYISTFLLWSHKAINYNENLSGITDYILAKRSPLGKEIFEKPFFVAVEAKKDSIFRKNLKSHTISELDSLLGAIAYIFEQYRLQLER